jgi:hypothetical protein
MRLHLMPPRVKPEETESPSECPYEDCNGYHSRMTHPLPKKSRSAR